MTPEEQLTAYFEALRWPQTDPAAHRQALMQSASPAQQAFTLAEQTVAIYGSPASFLEPLARAYLGVVEVLGTAYEAALPSSPSPKSPIDTVGECVVKAVKETATEPPFAVLADGRVEPLMNCPGCGDLGFSRFAHWHVCPPKVDPKEWDPQKTPFTVARCELEAALKAFREEWPSVEVPVSGGTALRSSNVKAWDALLERNMLAGEAMNHAMHVMKGTHDQRSHYDHPKFLEALERMTRAYLQREEAKIEEREAFAMLFEGGASHG